MTQFNKLAYFDGAYGHLTTVSDEGVAREIVTTRAHPDRYIKVDDGRQYPQLCTGGGYRGGTLTWDRDPERMGKTFARDCRARFFTDQAKYLAAVAELREANRRQHEEMEALP